MSGLAEGPHSILFGSFSVTARTRLLPAYLARPDKGGSYPSIVVAHSAAGITPSLKYLCRVVARHGFAVIVPDLYRGSGPAKKATDEQAKVDFESIPTRSALGDLAAVYSYVNGPSTEWAEPHRIGVLGVQHGGPIAAASVAAEDSLLALGLIESPLRGDVVDIVDLLGGISVPVLGIYAKDSESVAESDVAAARAATRRSQWALYEGVAEGFIDDSSDAFDLAAGSDAVQRIVDFFAASLQPTPAA